jgi:hypothetical protein
MGKITIDKSGYQEYNRDMNDPKNYQKSSLPTPIARGLLTTQK